MADLNRQDMLEKQQEATLTALLECSRTQLAIVTLDRERDDFLSLFDRSVQEWNAYVLQLEENQKLVGIFKSENTVAILQEIASIIDLTKSTLQQSAEYIGTDLQLARSQRKLMNAYYGMAHTDQVPLYFDQKK